MAQTQWGRYYVNGSVVPFEEDLLHEFKGHVNLSVEEIPHWAYTSGGQTRAPVSRAICAFVNSAAGGTVYCGILDDGLVQGLCKTHYQLDHFKLSLQDLLSRYSPSVDPHRISVNFVPVVDEHNTEEQITQILMRNSKPKVDLERRNQPHQLREKSFTCWCVTDAKAQLANKPENPLYVIEIVIHPWNPADPRNTSAIGRMRTLPVHEEECHKAYFRCQGMVMSYTAAEVHAAAEETVHAYYRPRIDKLKEELYKLRLQAQQKASKR